MKVHIDAPYSTALVFADSVRYEDEETTVVLPDGDVTTYDAEANVTIATQSFTRGQFEAAYQDLTCPCGKDADYLCSCGCPCCGDDPCRYNCGGAVRPLHEAKEKSIIPDSSLAE